MSDNTVRLLCLVALACLINWARDRAEQRAHEKALAKCQTATQTTSPKPSEKAAVLSE